MHTTTYHDSVDTNNGQTRVTRRHFPVLKKRALGMFSYYKRWLPNMGQPTLGGMGRAYAEFSSLLTMVNARDPASFRAKNGF